MAQVKPLKINSNGLPKEVDITSDEVTYASFTVNGGAVLSSTGLDMNNTDISDVNDLSFTDPTSDGITRTDGTHAADDIMFQDAENSMDAGAAILFPSISDNADQLDAFRLPSLAGAPSATPADGGEGYLIWDSSADNLYAWDGSGWTNLSIVEQAERVCSDYSAGEALLAGDVVYISAANTVSKTDVTSIDQAVGVAAAAAASAATVQVCTTGVVPAFTGLTAGSRYYVDETAPGGVSTTVPTASGSSIIQVGFAKSATEIDLQFQYMGCRA